jgi:hypothetical protein
MKPLSKIASTATFAALAALMLATRFHHFGTALNLPDASMAIFFLGGLYLRRHALFGVFTALALAIDWIAVSMLGTDPFCVTPAYSFLLPAYAVLWYGGRRYADRLQPSLVSGLGALAVAFASASLSFLVSNGAFYWLGGQHAEPSLAGNLASAWTWGPLFVGTTMAWMLGAALVHGLYARLLAGRAVGARA